VNNLYTVHKFFNQACSIAGIQTELLISEDNLKVILTKQPLSTIAKRLQRSAIANNIIAETKRVSAGTMVVITSDPKISVSSIINSADNKFGKFYKNLNEAFDKPWEKKDEKEDKPDEKKKDWEPDEDEPPRAKDRFFEDRKIMLNKAIDEALDGIAVPDGAAQPKVGVEMLQQALDAKTKSGITLKNALQKQGITWHVAEPGSHVIVFKGKSGDEKWRVEPMTLSDKKVFEDTMEALWSVALGKSPNAKELEREAAKQRAKELSDHQKEISGLVDQITGKYAPPAPEQETAVASK